MPSGIYLIVARNTFYVGSSKDIEHRIIAHKSTLKTNTHFCKRMQNIYNKYGSEVFSFHVIEEVVNEDDILACEQKWLDNLFAELHSKHILNARRIAERNTGVKFSEETKQKISQALKGKYVGRKATQEARENLSKALKGRKRVLSPQERKRRSEKKQVWLDKKEQERQARINMRPKYTLYDPDGVKYENIIYIHQFCIDNGLDSSSMLAVLKGKRKHHKWWTSDFNAIPRYTFVSPEGVVYHNVYNIQLFSKEHNLNVWCLYDLGRGRINSLYGWKKIHASYPQHDTK